MFISRPIKKIELKENVLRINDKEFTFSSNSCLDREIVESLINKGAYASALLYINKNSLLESIDGNKISKEEYKSFLQECKNLLKENVYKASDNSFRPLGNINGLELMENDKYIARGKHTLFIEDFRQENTESAEDIISNFQNSDMTVEEYMNALNKISYLENEGIITKDQYEEYINTISSVFADNRHKAYTEEVEGTQTSDVAEKLDQDLGKEVIVPEMPTVVSNVKLKEGIDFNYNVGYNHRFKGFILDEHGRFTRKNYVLINENGKIRAIKKSLLESFNEDEYGNIILTKEQCNAIIPNIIKNLNEKYKDYEYEFEYRLQDTSEGLSNICIYDATENFDYEDSNFYKVENDIKKALNSKVYLEPETKVTMIIAGCYVK